MRLWHHHVALAHDDDAFVVGVRQVVVVGGQRPGQPAFQDVIRDVEIELIVAGADAESCS